MKVIKKIDEMKKLRFKLTEPVGLVPTMGYLHEGHLSLVKQARAENLTVVVSIFVNPTQFGPREDFQSYPRDSKRDLTLLKRELVDIIFMPQADEMYPESCGTWVEVGKVTERLEGASRPSHFRGVATVVAKLFNIIRPDKAYFGQKDAQQVIVIKKMVSDLNMNLEVITLPTVRETDGLAMSSRNTYLSQLERETALVIYKTLNLARELWSRGEKDTECLRQEMIKLIQKQPLASIDYVSIANAETLEELDTVMPPALVSLSLKIGKTRLIDNIVLK